MTSNKQAATDVQLGHNQRDPPARKPSRGVVPRSETNTQKQKKRGLYNKEAALWILGFSPFL